ncbi:MAG: heme exporter protein CcmB [Rhodospirillaceae bacterium]|nr:heme exporter protein CcmB [Rhodospirillaceae bacterium]
MSAFATVLKRDLTLAFRHGADSVTVVAFFAIVAVLFAFGVGPSPDAQARIAAAVVWTTALLAVLLSLDRLFAQDHDDGSLDQLIINADPLVVVAAKTTAHWLATAAPLLVMAPAVAVALQMPVGGLAPLMIGLALGTPTLSLLGAVGAALVLGARRGGVLLGVLLLPLFIPILIFGTAAVDAGLLDLAADVPLKVLGGLLLLALALCPWAATAAVRHALE